MHSLRLFGVLAFVSRLTSFIESRTCRLHGDDPGRCCRWIRKLSGSRANTGQTIQPLLRASKPVPRGLALLPQAVALIECSFVGASRPRRIVPGDKRGQFLFHLSVHDARRPAAGHSVNLGLNRGVERITRRRRRVKCIERITLLEPQKRKPLRTRAP